MTNNRHLLIALIVVLAAISVNATDVRAACSFPFSFNNYYAKSCATDPDCPSSYADGDTCYYNSCDACCGSGSTNALLSCYNLGVIAPLNTCAWDSIDTDKPTCNECYTATCTDGWGCEMDPDGTACVTAAGLGGLCNNGVCELRGCEYDSECGTEAGTNRLGKCCAPSPGGTGCPGGPYTYTCSYGPCTGTLTNNEQCGGGFCCDAPVGGVGNCVPKGTIMNNNQYLCDPPDWTITEKTESEQVKQTKNIIRKIFDIFLAL